MSINLQIKEMSLKDKLFAMETIWDDLCHNEQPIQSPPWHDEILQERLKESKESNKFSDWEVAKQNIRNSLPK